MRTKLRQARERAGVSMAELAARLGVSVPSVSTLELNDERGAAKVETVEKALDALGLTRWDTVLPKEEMATIEQEAREIAEEVSWTMTLEAQSITDEDVEAIVTRLVARKVAALR